MATVVDDVRDSDMKMSSLLNEGPVVTAFYDTFARVIIVPQKL